MKKHYSLYFLAIMLLFGACSDHDDDFDDLWNGEGGWNVVAGEKYTDYGENNFISTASEPLSTFSVDCDGASYAIMRRNVKNQAWSILSLSVRVEEYLNYFTFNYPEPTDGHHVSTDTEVTVCPWNPEHLLLRIGLKGKTIPESELPPTNYVLLIDVSGSMSSSDKLDLLKQGFIRMVDALRTVDKVAIVTYSGTVGVALPSTSCDDKNKIKKVIAGLHANGSTAGGQALVTAYEIAVENYIPDGNNRIILGTDGDFNVGISSDEELVELIESKRDQGIYLTVLGVGSGNLNDSMMEKIANKGNGTYEYIDNVEQSDKVFIHERSKFYTIAKDCKVQLSFNPELVDKYRLIGYENRIMDNEDFEDDRKDAGEIGVGQSVTALYELIPCQAGGLSGDYAGLDVRYKKPGNEESLLISGGIPGNVVAIEDATEHTRFAASVAAFGMLLKKSEFAGEADPEMVLSLGRNAITYDPYGYRAEFLQLAEKVDYLR